MRCANSVPELLLSWHSYSRTGQGAPAGLPCSILFAKRRLVLKVLCLWFPLWQYSPGTIRVSAAPGRLLVVFPKFCDRANTANRTKTIRRMYAMLRNRWLIWILGLLLVPASLAQQKKRIAVLNFEYGTVQSSVAAIFGTNTDVGRGISDLLVQKLVQDGKYSVIERNALDKILAEQNFSNSDRADATTAATIGRVLRVDAVVVGSITQFGRDDKNTTVGGGAVGGITRRFGVGGVQKRDAKAVVAVSARMIDTSTAEILSAVTGNGESSRGGTSLVGGGGGGGDAAGGGF